MQSIIMLLLLHMSARIRNVASFVLHLPPPTRTHSHSHTTRKLTLTNKLLKKCYGITLREERINNFKWNHPSTRLFSFANNDHKEEEESNTQDHHIKEHLNTCSREKSKIESTCTKRNSSNKELFLNQINVSMVKDILPTIMHDVTYNEEENNETKSIKSLNILLAVSGGCDSVALFHSILQIMNEKGRNASSKQNLYYDPTLNTDTKCHDSEKENDIQNAKAIECEIHVVHFDHQQRGSESDGDREFVQKLCEQYDIPFHCYYWEQQEKQQKKRHQSKGNENRIRVENNTTEQKFSQEIARNWRRDESLQLLKNICTNNDDCPGILFTAHHKDDAEETMIMKFLRGVHITNLTGMDPILKQHQHRLNYSSDDNGGRKPYLYLAKPMLRIRKRHIHQFLTEQGFSWREDESNKTDKYLRNRVRNQLMPLLQDIVGGEEVLGSRLDNLEDQSRKIRDDITSRAEQYLNHDESSVSSSSPKMYFRIPQSNDGNLDLAEEEALHLWIQRESNNGLAMSYDKVALITEQLKNFPHRREWKLSLGGNWFVQRCGDVFELIHPSVESDVKDDVTKTHSDWTMKRLSAEDEHSHSQENIGHYILEILLPNDDDQDPNLYFQTVEQSHNMKFMPPWRNSEMKIKEFLRGQKVALHHRNQAPVLCTDVGGLVQIVAVFVENKESEQYPEGRWVVNKSWSCDDKQKNIQKCLIVRRTRRQ